MGLAMVAFAKSKGKKKGLFLRLLEGTKNVVFCGSFHTLHSGNTARSYVNMFSLPVGGRPCCVEDAAGVFWRMVEGGADTYQNRSATQAHPVYYLGYHQ